MYTEKLFNDDFSEKVSIVLNIPQVAEKLLAGR
jgi:hypothetical protein